MSGFDELLNKFLDNDITIAELDEFNKLLNVSENQVKYKSAQILESALVNMTMDSAPNNITDEIMKKLSGSKRILKPDKFMIMISTIFIVSIIVISSYLLFKPSPKMPTTNITFYLNEFINFIHVNKNIISEIMKNQFVFIIGVFSSFFLLMNFIFSLNSYKSLKEKITKV